MLPLPSKVVLSALMNPHPQPCTSPIPQVLHSKPICAVNSASDVGVRVASMATDAAALLRRFAWRLSFSDDAHGGGRDSNARLLPYLLQMGRYLVEASTSSELQVGLVYRVKDLGCRYRVQF